MTREEEIMRAAIKYAEKIDYDLWTNTEHPKSYIKMLVMAAAEDNAKWADEHPSVETMLKLFWFFDKHGLIKEDLCFDPQHFMETVAKEHFPNFTKYND